MSFPRLFDDGQYSMDQYQNNLGLGTLIDATSCKITEGLNGEYELELTYPLNSQLAAEAMPSPMPSIRSRPQLKAEETRLLMV